MFYEFRRVMCAPSKVGLYTGLMGDKLAPLLAKHEIEAVGFFNVVIGPGMAHDFPYLLRWQSHDERTAKLAAFDQDPALQEIFEEAEQDGPLVIDVVNELWAPTDYAPLRTKETAEPGLYEYRISQPLASKKSVVHWRNAEWNVNLYRDHDMHYVAAWDALVGHSSYVHYMMRWTSIEERQRKWGEYFQDPRWQEVSGMTGPLTRHVPNELWTPTAYSPILK